MAEEELLERVGCSPEEAEARAKKISFGFEPGDIVSQVMSFGSPTPVEVVVVGPGAGRGSRARAEGPRRNEEDSTASATCSFISNSITPRCSVDIDREKAGLSGVTVKDVTDALLVGTSSSRYVAKNYWRDPEVGRRLPGPGPGSRAADEPPAAG